MLYLMLVAVFNSVAKKWWFFFLLGYCECSGLRIINLAVSICTYIYTQCAPLHIVLPLPFVIVTLAVRWEHYGVTETEQSKL